MEIIDTLDNGQNELQITTIGSVVGSTPDGAPITQNFSEEALAAIAEAQADDEILIDVDHESERGQSTKAAGWLSKLKFIPGKGLTGIAKWTSIGKELIANRIYRWVSPTFWLNADSHKPVGLKSIALTNRPSQEGRIAPIVNSACFPTGMIPLTISNEEKDILKTMSKEELLECINSAIDAKLAALNSSCADKPAEVENSADEVEQKENAETADEAADKADETAEEKTETASEAAMTAADEQPAEVEDEEKTADEVKEEKTEEVVKEEALNSSPASVSRQLDGWKNLRGKDFMKWLDAHPKGL